MSEIRVDKLKGENGSSTVELTTGATIPSGKTVVGAGADFTIRNITGVAATFSGQLLMKTLLISTLSVLLPQDLVLMLLESLQQDLAQQ